MKKKKKTVFLYELAMNQKYPFIRSRNIFSFGDFWESNFVRKKNTPWTGGAKIPFQWMERWKKAAFQFSLFLLISFLNFPTSYLLVKRAVKGSFLSEIHSNMNKTARATFEIPPWRIWLWRILTSQMDVENCRTVLSFIEFMPFYKLLFVRLYNKFKTCKGSLPCKIQGIVADKAEPPKRLVFLVFDLL